MAPRDRVLIESTLTAGHLHWQPGMRFARAAGSDDWHLLLTLSGAGLVGTHEATHAAPAGTLALWRPGVPQAYRVAPEATTWERLWIHLRPTAAQLELFTWPECSPGLMLHRPLAEHVAELMSALRACVDLTMTGRSRLALNRLEYALLVVSEELQQSNHGRDPRIDRVAAAVAADLRGDWSVANMARLVELSPVQLTRLCSRHLGESPHRLVERLRLDAASRELTTGTATAQEIAARVGFANVSHFTRRFRAQFAMPPGTWRERNRR